jgi:hypothetical protein
LHHFALAAFGFDILSRCLQWLHRPAAEDRGSAESGQPLRDGRANATSRASYDGHLSGKRLWALGIHINGFPFSLVVKTISDTFCILHMLAVKVLETLKLA